MIFLVPLMSNIILALAMETELNCKTKHINKPCISSTSMKNELKGNPGVKGNKGNTGIKGSKGVAGDNGDPGNNENVTSKGCPGVTFHFPRDQQTEDYVQYRGYFPTLRKATVCGWIEANRKFPEFEAILSYASSTSSEDNELLVGLGNYQSKVEIYVGGNNNIHTMNSDFRKEKFHLCAWVSSENKKIGFYINGEKKEVKETIEFQEISGGGVLVLGQEQDLPIKDIGRFDKNQCLKGNITNLMIWPRVLSDQEINDIATKCDCPQDYALAMTMDRSELHGDVYYSVSDLCPIV